MRISSRFHSTQPGIETWHAFSAGAHYDPDRLSFGDVVGCDEHRVDPGAGFDWHSHRGVHIVSVVLSGTLWHRDAEGGERFVPAGDVLVQSTGAGVRHAEFNASDADPLHFVQVTILADGNTALSQTRLPTEVASVRISRSHSWLVLTVPGKEEDLLITVEV